MVAKRMLARMLAAALVALALVPMMATAAYADDPDFEVDGLQYTINAGDATVTVSKAPCDILGAVTIPGKVESGGRSYTVTAIGDGAFQGCTGLGSVNIPAPVMRIGEDAFADCGSLVSIGIPASVTSIGERAFEYCTSLGSVEIPASVTSIGGDAFAICTSLSKVEFAPGSQLETIGGGAFYECGGLGSIAIPATVRGIGESAFSLTGLTAVELPEGLETISGSLFYGCGSLTRVTIPSTVTRIENFAFGECSTLSKLDFGGSQLQWAAIEWWAGNSGIEPASFGKYDVTFDSRGGSEVPFQAVAPGGKATAPQAPTKDGMVFDGWYSDEDPANPFDFSNTAIDADLALHAVYHCAGHQWEQKVQKATPTSDGRVYQKCGVCGAEQGNVPLPKVGTIKLAKASFTYTGKAIQPTVTVANASEALSADCYTVSYSGNVNAGTASVKVTLKGAYHEGSKTLKFTIARAKVAVPKSKAGLVYNGKAQTGVAAGEFYAAKGNSATGAGSYKATLTADANHVFSTGKATAAVPWSIAKAANTLSAKAKAKKAVAVKAGKALAAKKLFKVSKAKGKVAYKKAKGSKKISVAKDGKVSVKKGCKAGTYALTVKVRAAGDANYKASTWKAVKVKVLVK